MCIITFSHLNIAKHKAHRSQRVGMIVGADTLAHKGGGDRNGELFRKAYQGLLDMSTGGSVSGKQQGSFGLLQQRHRASNLRGRGGGITNNVDREWVGTWGCWHRLNILGYGKVDGSGAQGLCLLERFAHHFWYSLRSEDRFSPLSHRLEHVDQVNNLVRLFVNAVKAHLGADGNQRCAIGGGIRRPQQQVDRTRPECGATNPSLPGQTSVDVSHEGRSLFMACQDIPDG